MFLWPFAAVALVSGLIGYLIGINVAKHCMKKNQASRRKNRPKRSQGTAVTEEREAVMDGVLERYRDLSREAEPPRQTPREPLPEAPRAAEPKQEAQTPRKPSVQVPFQEWNQEQQDQYYRRFQTFGMLSADFNYNFPDNLLLIPGKEYLFSSDGCMIPDRSIYSGMNSVKDYAMDGLFYLYDVSLSGTIRTFEDCIGEESGYVRIVSVLQPARIQAGAGGRYYVLKKKGLLSAVPL